MKYVYVYLQNFNTAKSIICIVKANVLGTVCQNKVYKNGGLCDRSNGNTKDGKYFHINIHFITEFGNF